MQIKEGAPFKPITITLETSEEVKALSKITEMAMDIPPDVWEYIPIKPLAEKINQTLFDIQTQGG